MNKDYLKMDVNSQEPSDGLVPEKSLTGDVVSTNYSGGIISPVENVSLSDDSANIEILDEDDNLLASFCCDVASTMQQKIIGLQKHNSLDKNAGLLFPYNNSEDVIYHMGNVKFPIDIIFADADNKIKKIYKNIQPGTLATFGCAGVRNVLEIYGGLSDRLSISVGNYINVKNENSKITSMINKLSKQYGTGKTTIVKYSNYEKERVGNWHDYPMLCVGDSITKSASPRKFFSQFIKNNSKFENVSCFYFDGLIKKESSSLDTHNDYYELFNQMRKDAKSKNKIILATNYSNDIESYIYNKMERTIGQKVFFDIEKIKENSDHLNIIENIKNKYKTSKIKLYSDPSILKQAGIPIPNEVKEKAKRAYKHLIAAEKICQESLDNMKKNVSEYEKIKDNQQALSESKGQYNQSIKSNTKVAREYLIKIRDAIKILNEIKDMSTTIEVIDVITSSSKIASETLENIFELIEDLDKINFYILLSEKVSIYTRNIEDLKLSIERAKNYINSDILGLVIVSS